MSDKAHGSENNEQIEPIKIEGDGNVDEVSADSARDYLENKVSYHTAPLASHP